MNAIARVIQAPERKWQSRPAATETEIEALRAALPFKAPELYVEFLRHCNGGEGELALRPLWFQLFDIDFAIELWRDPHYRSEFPNFFFFGSNAGLESIAFDMTGPPPWPIVMVDCIAGPDSAHQLTSDFTEFVAAIGRIASDDEV